MRGVPTDTPLIFTHHYIILMQLLTPSAVAIADRIASAVCTTNFQNSLFFMILKNLSLNFW